MWRSLNSFISLFLLTDDKICRQSKIRSRKELEPVPPRYNPVHKSSKPGLEPFAMTNMQNRGHIFPVQYQTFEGLIPLVTIGRVKI